MRAQFSVATVLIALTFASSPVLADGGHRGFHGSAHVSAAGHSYGGPHVIGARGYYGPRYYGGRVYGHYYGRPYYRGYWGYGPRWYGALALGTFVATLPLYYDAFWWGGVRYYYYDDTYYLWNSRVSEYEVVAPPEGRSVASSDVRVSESTRLFVYPTQGQSEEQQKTDRYECHRWAADQTGFDPTQGSDQDTSKRGEYTRAEMACLTGRGYSVK